MPGVVSLCFPAGHPWSGVWVRQGGDAGVSMVNVQSQCLLWDWAILQCGQVIPCAIPAWSTCISLLLLTINSEMPLCLLLGFNLQLADTL